MRLNIRSLQIPRITLGLSILRSPRNVIFKLWRALNSGNPFISLTQVLATAEFLKPFRKSLERMTGFTCILILDQMIQRLFLIPSASWYLLVLVGILYWTTSLWLLAVLGVKLQQTPLRTSRRASKSSSTNSVSP